MLSEEKTVFVVVDFDHFDPTGIHSITSGKYTGKYAYVFHQGKDVLISDIFLSTD